MKAVANIGLCLITLLFATSVLAQTSATNAPIQEIPATSNSVPVPIPVVEFHDVPLSTAVENLALQAGINFIVDSRLNQRWADSSEPAINCKWKTITAQDALARVLKIYRLALVDGPLSNIAIITTADEAARGTFAEAAGVETNSYSEHTNLIPVIRFSDVPLSTAIENLALQENLNYTLDPTLSEGWVGEGKREPSVNLRLETVTGWATLNRMLQAYHLVLVENPASHIARITAADTPLHKVDASLLHIETGTNNITQTNESIPVIRFSDVPLDAALENLIRASGLNIGVDPRITGKSSPEERWFDPMPEISIRWENTTPKQALVALCEDYDLVITNNENGNILITPLETKRHHHLNLR